ncbi:MAG: hypothetical protein ACRCU2_08675 [Planktothrix sp.]
MSNVQNVNQFEPENKCPDCVFMRLELEPIETKTGIWIMSKSEVKSLNLFLTLNFNWQEEKIWKGKIRFGINKGTLSLTLINCISPYESRNFLGKLDEEFSVETETKNSNNYKASLSGSGSLSPNPKEIKFQTGLGVEGQYNREENHKFKTTARQISGKGSENNPKWDFEVKDDNPCLKGSIERNILTNLKINDNSCIIEAIFTADKESLSIEGINGIWGNTKISKNKTAIITEFVLHVILKPKLHPYLSKQELRHDQ